ncbi:hypothetical protein PMAYCL1PPCAC_21283, partial [Pristionchus mayeri]
MSVFIKIYEDTNLGNLPGEVIRQIILMDKDNSSHWASELQSISPAWNNMVVELQDRGELNEIEPTIERAYLCAGVPRNDWRVEMHALLRRSFASLVGANRESHWLRPKDDTFYDE